MGRRTGSGNGGQSVGASGLRNGVFTGVGVRPIGFQFPVGLNVTVAAVPDGPTSVDYLVVAGGGGGGIFSNPGGGGGAGGFLTGTGHPITLATPYSITVGGGGDGDTSPGSVDDRLATNGSSSIFSSITAIGGGRGSTGVKHGSGGGSGGGANYQPDALGGLATPGQGNNGGNGGGGAPVYFAGGGGGAGGPGANGSPCNGGAGSPSSYSGSPVTYAGGGGGAKYGAPGGTGGSGIGGNGGYNGVAGTNGSPNTGSGGGGGAYTPGAAASGAGGKGIVIIRYSGSQGATGGTVTSSGGYTIHTFTGDGTFTSNVGITGQYSIN